MFVTLLYVSWDENTVRIASSDSELKDLHEEGSFLCEVWQVGFKTQPNVVGEKLESRTTV